MTRPGEVTTMRLDGALSFDTVDAWLARIDLPKGRAGSVAFDLAGVTHADSAGLALLLELRRRAREAGIDSTFSGVPRQLARIAAHFGLTRVIELPGSEATPS